MRIACLLIPHLPYQVERRRQSKDLSYPLMITKGNETHRYIYDSSEGGKIPFGTPLQEALSAYKNCEVIEADEFLYKQINEEILDEIQERLPVIEDAGLGCIFIDLQGSEILYPNDAYLARALLEAIPFYLQGKLGIASGKFTAYLSALQSRSGSATRAHFNQEGFLQGFSINLLPISKTMKNRLHGFELHSLGDLVPLGIGPLQAQFGPEGNLAWKLSSGNDERPVIPRSRQEVILEELVFPTPTVSLAFVLLGMEALVGRVWSRIEKYGYHIREMTVYGNCFPSRQWSKRIVFREPVGSKEMVIAFLKRKLESTFLPGPLEDLRLQVEGFTGSKGKQKSLFLDLRRKEQIGEAVQQLETQFNGKTLVYRYQEVEPFSRIPERRGALIPFVH